MPRARITDIRFVRKLDLATFTGDAWAVDATLAAPDLDDVPPMLATGGKVEWSVYAMDGDGPTASMEAETTTTITTCLVKLATTSPTGATTLVSPCVAVSGAILNHPVMESDVERGDVFVLAIPSISVGTATWLWIVPHSGYVQEPQ